jgi:hypothetical protein
MAASRSFREETSESPICFSSDTAGQRVAIDDTGATSGAASDGATDPEYANAQPGSSDQHSPLLTNQLSDWRLFSDMHRNLLASRIDGDQLRRGARNRRRDFMDLVTQSLEDIRTLLMSIDHPAVGKVKLERLKRLKTAQESLEASEQRLETHEDQLVHQEDEIYKSLPQDLREEQASDKISFLEGTRLNDEGHVSHRESTSARHGLANLSQGSSLPYHGIIYGDSADLRACEIDLLLMDIGKTEDRLVQIREETSNLRISDIFEDKQTVQHMSYQLKGEVAAKPDRLEKLDGEAITLTRDLEDLHARLGSFRHIMPEESHHKKRLVAHFWDRLRVRHEEDQRLLRIRDEQQKSMLQEDDAWQRQQYKLTHDGLELFTAQTQGFKQDEMIAAWQLQQLFRSKQAMELFVTELIQLVDFENTSADELLQLVWNQWSTPLAAGIPLDPVFKIRGKPKEWDRDFHLGTVFMVADTDKYGTIDSKSWVSSSGARVVSTYPSLYARRMVVVKLKYGFCGAIQISKSSTQSFHLHILLLIGVNPVARYQPCSDVVLSTVRLVQPCC